jgi:hypothetical protein
MVTLGPSHTRIPPRSRIETTYAIQEEITEHRATRRDRMPAIKRNEDLCVSHAPTDELSEESGAYAT